jgi:hypothetical protein
VEKTIHELFDLARSMPITKLSKHFEMTEIGMLMKAIMRQILRNKT